MNKIKKINKIIGISAFLLFLAFPINVLMAETTVWYYTWTINNGTISTVDTTSDNFATIDLCNEDRNIFIKENIMETVSECQSKVITDNVHKLDAQKDVTNSKTYELLAPIGNLKTIETTNIGDYFNKFFLLAIGLAGALAVIMLVVGGVEWMGTDSVFGKTEAKKRITSAILGLVIAIGSYALLNTINPDLLGKSGLNIAAVTIKLDPEVHGDTPQTPINGKYCDGKYSVGETWPSDETERLELINNNISFNKNTCSSVGQQNCTSVAGLNTYNILALKRSCGSSCTVTITGGTECWLHSNKTKHLPGNSIVDLRINGVSDYIETGSEEKVSSSGFPIFVKNGASFLKEGDHYHVISW